MSCIYPLYNSCYIFIDTSVDMRDFYSLIENTLYTKTKKLKIQVYDERRIKIEGIRSLRNKEFFSSLFGNGYFKEDTLREYITFINLPLFFTQNKDKSIDTIVSLIKSSCNNYYEYVIRVTPDIFSNLYPVISFRGIQRDTESTPFLLDPRAKDDIIRV